MGICNNVNNFKNIHIESYIEAISGDVNLEVCYFLVYTFLLFSIRKKHKYMWGIGEGKN